MSTEPIVLDLAAQPALAARARWRWVVMPVRGIVAGLVGLFGLFIVVVHLLIRSVTPVLVVGVVLLVVSAVLYALWGIQNRRVARAQGRTRVVLDDRGIATTSEAGANALAWERFERWHEDDEAIVVLSRVDKDRGVVVLPTAELGEGQLQAVRTLLVDRVEATTEPLDDAFVEDEDPA